MLIIKRQYDIVNKLTSNYTFFMNISYLIIYYHIYIITICYLSDNEYFNNELAIKICWIVLIFYNIVQLIISQKIFNRKFDRIK